MSSTTNGADQDAMRVANRYASLIEKAETLQGRAQACEDAARQYRGDARANQASAEQHRVAARTIRDQNVAHQHANAARDAEAEAAREILAARYYEEQAKQYTVDHLRVAAADITAAKQTMPLVGEPHRVGADTSAPAAIKDPLRVANRFVLPAGQSFAGSGTAKNDDGYLLLAAAVDTPHGRVVHVGVPIDPLDKPHWAGAHAPAQKTHIDPDSDPDDEDRITTVDTGAAITVVLPAAAAAQLPAQVDAIVAEATEADQRYRKYAKRCDKLYAERSALQAKRFTDPADADLQLRLDGLESQHVKYQRRRRAEMDEAADRLSPADRARYDDLQRRIDEAGTDRFHLDTPELAAAVCGMTVTDYHDLLELKKTPYSERTAECTARSEQLTSPYLPPLLAEQAAIVRGLDLNDYRELETLQQLGRPHRGYGGRLGGRTPQQQARYEHLCNAPGGATGTTPRQTAELRDQFETYLNAHHSDKLSWTAERQQRAALADRARPLGPADAARLQQITAELDELSDLCETLGGEVIASVEVPGCTGTTLLVEAVQREEEGGVDYSIWESASEGDAYLTTASGLRKAAKMIADLAGSHTE